VKVTDSVVLCSLRAVLAGATPMTTCIITQPTIHSWRWRSNVRMSPRRARGTLRRTCADDVEVRKVMRVRVTSRSSVKVANDECAKDNARVKVLHVIARAAARGMRHELKRKGENTKVRTQR
jgi:hypothetical protein